VALIEAHDRAATAKLLKMAREKKFEARVRATGADLNQSANFAQSK
jgi:hypothetical protein